jgi:serine/threonine protein kinase
MNSKPLGTLAPGTRVASYEIEKVLGIGGFGITYRGRDTTLGCEVAIKEYLPSMFALRASDSDTVLPKSENDKKSYQHGLRRFLEEGRLLAKFKERSIVRVSQFLEANGTAYLVMDYEDGQSLADYLHRGGTFSENDLLTLFKPILEGLRAVHAVDFLHRDIKPGNIYLRKKGPPVLLDFGSAREALNDPAHAMTGLVTPGYAPFEQYNARGKQGPWTDLYALGATLYHCLAGRAPVGAPDRIAALQEHQADPLQPARDVARGRYRSEFLAIVDWMLAPLSKDRPQNVEALLARLNALGEVNPSAASSASLAKTEVVPVPEAPVITHRPPPTRDEIEVFKAFRRRAESGEAEAQFKLGVMYVSGLGTDRSDVEAVAWLQKAADQNHVAAQLRLGLMLARGAGAVKNETQAAAWLRKAADRNDAVAQFNLGLMHAHGLGVTKDIEAARRWYRKAAALGHAGARANLRVIERPGLWHWFSRSRVSV